MANSKNKTVRFIEDPLRKCLDCTLRPLGTLTVEIPRPYTGVTDLRFAEESARRWALPTLAIRLARKSSGATTSSR